MRGAGQDLLDEMEQIRIASDLITLGARLQVVDKETSLSRSQLSSLYRKIRGVSAPRGMLPYSAEWFTTWRPNIHASLFYNAFVDLTQRIGCSRIHAFIHAYRAYLGQAAKHGETPVLESTRAWTLLRFVDSGMLRLAPCTQCGSRFLVEKHAHARHFVCGMCNPPSRAGMTKERQAADRAAATA
ncbi:MAG TPA: flagellar transcriptional regulator FlhC [Nevskiaceae bacterium]|nr:flagellar transcriptional regulator FlhC [Nevskiaceae bacterium]